MSHSTKLSPSTINQQAQRHDDTGEQISKSLDDCKNIVAQTLSASPSAATRALQSTCENWVENVRKSTLEHLNAMATNIRREANNQESTDQDSNQAIMNLPMETGNFLGV